MSKWSTANQRYHAEIALWRDAQPMVHRCMFCDWSAEGLTGELRDASKQHRIDHHPETLRYKRRRPVSQLGNFRPPPIREDEADEIETERVRRAFLNGVKL